MGERVSEDELEALAKAIARHGYLPERGRRVAMAVINELQQRRAADAKREERDLAAQDMADAIQWIQYLSRGISKNGGPDTPAEWNAACEASESARESWLEATQETNDGAE